MDLDVTYLQVDSICRLDIEIGCSDFAQNREFNRTVVPILHGTFVHDIAAP
jgi:hypothetical protein